MATSTPDTTRTSSRWPHLNLIHRLLTKPPSRGRASIKRRTDKWVEKRADLIQREWDSWDPQTGIGAVESICNDPGTAATAYATIAAGGTVSACYNDPWAHNSGPLTVYMTACPDDDCTTITTDDLADLKWFAIYKEGLVDGEWATSAYMESNSNCITHIIPETLVAGSYLIRHETIVCCLPTPLHHNACN